MRTLQLNLYPLWMVDVEVGDALRKNFSDINYNGVIYKGSRYDRKYYKEWHYKTTVDSGIVWLNTNTYLATDTNELYTSFDLLTKAVDTWRRFLSREWLFNTNWGYAEDQNYEEEEEYDNMYDEYDDDDDDDEYDDDDDEHPSIYGFSDLSEWAEITIWLEIEKAERLSNGEYNRDFQGWAIHSDGSIEGGEHCTPILDIDKAIEYLSQDKFQKLFDLESSGSCWWHIHIANKNYNDRESFYNDIKHYRPILWAIYPDRARSARCGKNNSVNGRRADFSLWSNYKTIEVRIFPALDSLDQAKFRIWMLKFFITNPCQTKEQALNIINCKSVEFIQILHTVYDTLERKQEILKRIIEAYEIDPQTQESITNYLQEQCNRLNK